jgi:hypothetical protein
LELGHVELLEWLRRRLRHVDVRSRKATTRRREPPAANPAIAGMDSRIEDVEVALEDDFGIWVTTVEAAWIVVEATDGGDPVAAAMDVPVRVYDVRIADVESALNTVGSEVL